MRFFVKRLLPVILVVALGMLTACTTTIEQIKENPQKYAGRKVTIPATIVSSLSIPFTDYRVYTLGHKGNQVLLFSPVSREEGQDLIIKAEVVALSVGETEGSADTARESIETFLTQNNLASEKNAQKIGKAVYLVISKTAKALGSVFFLMEEGT